MILSNFETKIAFWQEHRVYKYIRIAGTQIRPANSSVSNYYTIACMRTAEQSKNHWKCNGTQQCGQLPCFQARGHRYVCYPRGGANCVRHSESTPTCFSPLCRVRRVCGLACTAGHTITRQSFPLINRLGILLWKKFLNLLYEQYSSLIAREFSDGI